MEMGDRIRELRMSKGLTMEELGKLVGVQKSAVLKWENGSTKNLKASTIEKLSDIFGVTPSFVMGFDEPEYLKVETKRVPMLGEIADGEPILANDYCEYYVEIGADCNVDFCLKVKGDSKVYRAD